MGFRVKDFMLRVESGDPHLVVRETTFIPPHTSRGLGVRVRVRVRTRGRVRVRVGSGYLLCRYEDNTERDQC